MLTQRFVAKVQDRWVGGMLVGPMFTTEFRKAALLTYEQLEVVESIFGHVLCATVGAMPHASTIQDVWK